MKAKFVHVGITSTAPPVEALEKTFAKALDGFATVLVAGFYIRQHASIHGEIEFGIHPDVKSGDSFFLCEFTQYSGYQRNIVWNFLRKHKKKSKS